MSTQTQDSAPVAGAQVPPTPAASLPSAGQPNSANGASVPTPTAPGATTPPALNAEALVEQIVANPKLQQLIARQVQSVKDKRFSEIDRIAAALQANGMNAEAAKKDLMLEDVYQFAVSREANGTGVLPDPDQAKLQRDTAAILDEAKISYQDPELLQLSQSTPPERWLTVVSQLAIRRARGEAPAPAGALSSVGGGRTPATPDAEAQVNSLTAKLVELQKNPTLNLQAIMDTKNKLGALIGRG